MIDITGLLNSRNIIIFDGAMGTMLQRYGLSPGEKPDMMNIISPDTVQKIHEMYIEAGSDIICTNTFGANAISLEKIGYSPQQIIAAAMEAAKRAIEQKKKSPPLVETPPLVALNIGPTGQILEPAGELEYDRAYEVFAEMAMHGEKYGAQLVAIETMSDIQELKAAISAVIENTKLPVFATMTFETSGRTFMGCTTGQFAETAAMLGATAIGLNCSLEPQQMFETAKHIAEQTRLPLIIKPNAGLPETSSGHYSIGAEEFAAQMLPYRQLGVKIVGGCCGTTPEYIKALRKEFLDV